MTLVPGGVRVGTAGALRHLQVADGQGRAVQVDPIKPILKAP